MLASTLAATTADHNGLGILCVILLIATIIAIVVGLAELIGIGFVSNRFGNTHRGATLVVGIILLIIYVVLC